MESEKVLFLTDLHVPYGSQRTLDLVLNYAAKNTYTCIVLSELLDFYAISPFNRDPERVLKLSQELDESYTILHQITKQFKDQKRVYISGNHDERLRRLIWSKAPALAGLPCLNVEDLLGLTAFEWKYYDNKQLIMDGETPFSIGHLTFLHGHEIRMGWGAVNLAKIMYERARINVIAGHHHRCQEWIIRTIKGDFEGCWMVGCLSDLNPPYMPHNDHIHGFAEIFFDTDGDFEVRNRKVIKGKIL